MLLLAIQYFSRARPGALKIQEKIEYHFATVLRSRKCLTVFLTVSRNGLGNRYRKMILTSLGVKNAKSKEKAYKLADEKGLNLVVTPSGSKLWRFDYRFGDKRKTLALGKWDDVELADSFLLCES